MNIACFFGVLIIVVGEASILERSTHKNEPAQRILLRKLQYVQNVKRDDAKSVTWNEILADVLVNKIKIFSFNKVDEPSTALEKPKKSILKKTVSEILAIYKAVYDKFKTEDVLAASQKTSDNPKEEIEVIEPRKSEEPETSEVVEDRDCPTGQVKSEEGVCENAKQLKFILAIPNHCPDGYRADRLGYCRMRF